MPKRKLRLWFSKDDYKREREEELARLAKLEQNENATPTTGIENTTAEPAAADVNMYPIEVDPRVAEAEEEIRQLKAQSEKEAALAVTEGNLQPAETPPPPSPEAPIENVEPAVEPVLEQVGEAVPAEEPKQQVETASAEETVTQEEAKQTQVSAQLETASLPVEGEQQLLEASSMSSAPVSAEAEHVQVEVPQVPVEAIVPVEGSTSTQAAEAQMVEPEKEEPEIEMKVPLTDSVESIEKYTAQLKAVAPTKAVVCIGEYPINILLKGNLADKKDVLPIYVEKFSKDVIKWGQGHLDKNTIVCLDEEIDSHFWYDITPFMANKEGFFRRIKEKPLGKIKGAIIVSATWNGVGSALLPALHSQFKELKLNTIGLALLPSKAQPLDGQLNSFASLGILASQDAATVVLIDRDNLEEFTGVDNNGFTINGNLATNYLLDVMLSKDTFVPELIELSKSFDTKMFTVMFAPGMSVKIYNTLENILNTMLMRPLMAFDLSTATLLYVLIRMPFHLKDKFPRGKIELAVAHWFKDKADLESIVIADPVLTDDSNDRIDIALFIGGFDLATRFAALEKRVERMKNKAVKKGLIKEEDWQLIAKSLTE